MLLHTSVMACNTFSSTLNTGTQCIWGLRRGYLCTKYDEYYFKYQEISLAAGSAETNQLVPCVMMWLHGSIYI